MLARRRAWVSVALVCLLAGAVAAVPESASASDGVVTHVVRDGERIDVVHVARSRVAHAGTGATRSDFDGDGIDDLTVTGWPDAAPDAPDDVFGDGGGSGAVTVTYSSTPRDDLIVGEFHYAPGTGGCACFGDAVAAGDFDHDGYDDLAIGDDDAPTRGTLVGGHGGAVWVIPGSAHGLDTSRARRFTQDTAGVPGVAEDQDWFGFSLAAGDVNDDGYDDLAVGAPNEKVGRAKGAGAVTVLRGGPDGLTGRGAVTFSQSTRGVPGKAEKGDEFGFSLAIGRVTSDRYADLVVGTPRENATPGTTLVIGGTGSDGSGSVTLLRGSRAGLSFSKVTAVTGYKVANAALRAGTMKLGTFLWRLGTVVAAADVDGDGLDEVVVGTPAAEAAWRPQAGAVATIEGRSGLTTTGARVITQQTAGVPSGADDDEGFGTSIGVGDVTGDGRADVVVGTPLQSVGTAQRAGTFTILRGARSGLTGAGAVAVSRASSGVPGAARTDGLLGAAVGVLNLDGRGPWDIVVGDRGSQATGGTVLVFGGAAKGPQYRASVEGSAWAVPGVLAGVSDYGRRVGGASG